MRHRFAAVLAADVAHYSGLMESDGEATVRALQVCRNIFQRCVNQHHGREFGSVGDSLMAEFASPVEALRAAQDIQEALAEADPVTQSGERLRVRVGLHAGDVIVEDDNLFGDVVNTASRLQEIAAPGGIVLSRFVHHQVHKEPGVAFRSLGRQQLKNIQEPVRAYEFVQHDRALSLRRLQLATARYKPALAATLGVVVAALLFVGYLETRERTGVAGTIEVPEESTITDNSIAVLPFDSHGLTTQEEAFIAGIHGDIAMQLRKLGSLDRVMGRWTIDQHRDTPIPISEIVDDLGVATILVGNAQRVGNKLSVSVELIDTRDGSIISANSYDPGFGLERLFVLPNMIANDTVRNLNIPVSSADGKRMASIPTRNMEAFSEFTLGHREMLRLTPSSLKDAENHFRNAVELDPEYALAYVGIADALALRWKYDFRSSERFIPERQSLVRKALDIDPEAGPAYASLALIQVEQNDAAGAEKNFLKAIELSPNYAMAHAWYGDFLNRLGRHDDSLASIRTALDLDPTAPPVKMSYAAQLRWMGNVDQAIQVLLEGVNETPNFPEYYPELVTNYDMTGRFGQALRWADAGRDVAPHHQRLRQFRCRVLLNLGDFDAAERCYRSIEGDFPVHYVSHQITIHILRNEREEAVALVEQNINHPEARPFFRRRLASFYLEFGEPEKYLEFYREVDPSRLDIPVDYPPQQSGRAVELAMALYETGERDKANQLFDRAIELIDEFLEDYKGTQIAPVEFPIVFYILALREDKTELIETLRFLIDIGWRRDWFRLESRYFDFVRNDPEFVEQMTRLDEHVAREWQVYEELKD